MATTKLIKQASQLRPARCPVMSRQSPEKKSKSLRRLERFKAAARLKKRKNLKFEKSLLVRKDGGVPPPLAGRAPSCLRDEEKTSLLKFQEELTIHTSRLRTLHKAGVLVIHEQKSSGT